MSDVHVLIAGGGIAGVEAALGLRELAGDRVSVTFVSPQAELVHQRLGDAAFTLGDLHRHPFATVVERLGATLVTDEVVGVDPVAQTVRTRASGDLSYDVLLAATGARRALALDRAVPYGGPMDVPGVERVLDLVRRGDAERVAVVVPPAAAWSLPAYEVALRAAGGRGRPVVVTPEERPVDVFGPEASAAVTEELERAGVQVVHGIVADTEPGELFLVQGGSVSADSVIALPYVRGPRIEGLPADRDGFLPTDAHGVVDGAERVFGAGDGTTFPIRQGGIAAQQGAVAAANIARLAGAEHDLEALKPVVRGVLATGGGRLYLEHDLSAGRSRASRDPLWEPPHRVAGVRLPAFLEALDAAG